MIRFSVCGIKMRVHLLSIFFVALSFFLDAGSQMPWILGGVFLHEWAHVLMGLACRVRTEEIDLMPFGGAAKIENIYLLRPAQLIAVSIAGPAANLLACVIIAAMAWKGVFDGISAANGIKANLFLMGFNLVPALPLDGGRVLYALLTHRLSPGRALRIGVWLGQGLGIILGSIALIGVLQFHRFNLTLFISAVFLFYAAAEEKKALGATSAKALLASNRPLAKPVKASIYAIEETETARNALLMCKPNETSLFVIYRDGRIQGVLDKRTLLAAAADHSSLTAPLNEIAKRAADR